MNVDLDVKMTVGDARSESNKTVFSEGEPWCCFS